MTSELDELIVGLMNAVNARSDQEDTLSLPGWDASSWRLLLSASEIVELQEGEVLIRRGDNSSDLYFLVAGKLEVSIPQVKSISISPLVRIGPGSIVGELTFLDNRARSASVWSSGRSRLLRLRQAAFLNFRQAQPALACDMIEAIARVLAGRLRRVQGMPTDRAGTLLTGS
jgi:CRP-like cAMP-binding protein